MNNLPTIHPRERVVQEALFAFQGRLINIRKKLKGDVQLADEVRALGQCLAYVGIERPKDASLTKFGSSLDTALQEVTISHALTIGEQILMINGQIASAAKYLIRFERHGHADRPGGLA